MTKLGAVFWIGLVLASGFTTFKVKHSVQDIDDELNRLRKQTNAEQQEIRVLTAEWTYLNQPERLAELNKTFLQLTPVTPKQLQTRIEDIPLRATAAAPDVVMAAAAPAPTVATVAQPAAQRAPAAPARVAVAAPIAVPAAAPAPAAVRAAVASPSRPPVRLAKATGGGSLNALIAHIAETH